MTIAPLDRSSDYVSGSPTAARLIVCERSGPWAVALRAELAGASVRLAETRSLADAWQAMAATPAAFLIVEATAANLDSLLRRMAWFSRDFPLARVAVVAARRLAKFEWLMREAGAVHFVCSPRRLAPLAELVIRHMAGVPMPRQTLGERIWASLPWGKLGIAR